MNPDDLTPPSLLDSLADIANNRERALEEATKLVETIANEKATLDAKLEMVLRIFPELKKVRSKRKKAAPKGDKKAPKQG